MGPQKLQLFSVPIQRLTFPRAMREPPLALALCPHNSASWRVARASWAQLSLPFCIVVVLLLAIPGMRAQQPREIVRLAMDFNPTAANGNPGGLLVSNNKLYFVGTDGTHGIELWQTDGTNTTRLTDLSYGSVNSFIGPPVEFNSELYFRGSGMTNGIINLELWKY